ncbi:BppU family phage baseplate upper protein [Bacillus cereus]|uniref:BppU family phage baseplate upper protein n=1 Tax=Bacillus cereus TaxID=1396 RepID=UPI001D06335B|nr:BppU family phage baseplate upper protein [Bacillus cereus]MCB5900356.1 phage baseplate upper protein [Bacillus cereus]
MKIKLVLDINKTQQAQLNAVVTGRQGDKGTVTVNVFVVDGGVPYNLTGNTIYYEGLKPNNAYVRDTSGVKIINATQGNFEYTFRPETFGVAGIGKRSYFSIEQGGTVRASTQDFGLVTLADAMTGNTMSGPYISELEELINLAQWLVDDINSRWTSINDQLYQLQNKLDTMDVVRRSGDTMTGSLGIDTSNVGDSLALFFQDVNGMSLGFKGHKLSKTISLVDWEGRESSVWRYSQTDKKFIVDADTNLVKKTGDTMTGTLAFNNGNAFRLNYAGQKSWICHHPGSNTMVFAPETTVGSNSWDWAKGIEFKDDGTIRQATDTGWVPITLNAGVTSIDGRTCQFKRVGSTVTLLLNYRATSLEGFVIATLPFEARPSQPVDIHTVDGAGRASRVVVNLDGAISCSTINEDVRTAITYNI